MSYEMNEGAFFCVSSLFLGIIYLSFYFFKVFTVIGLKPSLFDKTIAAKPTAGLRRNYTLVYRDWAGGSGEIFSTFLYAPIRVFGEAFQG